MEKEKKLQMTAKDRENRVDIHVHELPELLDYITGMQAEIDMLNAFVRDVLISAIMPENVRLFFDDEYTGKAAEAMDALSQHMHDYRKILEFLRINGIDVNKIISDTGSKDLS